MRTQPPLRLALQAVRARLFRGSDVRRWADLDNHDPLWDERTEIVARLLPRGRRIIEFGAGRRRLQSFLDPGVTYVPADLVSRGPDTLVCDLNARPLPDLRGVHDTAVFGGVLEYVAHVPSLLTWLGSWATTCVASYECATSPARSFARRKEAWRRALAGWVNTYDEEELLALFRAAGYLRTEKVVWHTSDGDEPIFLLERQE